MHPSSIIRDPSIRPSPIASFRDIREEIRESTLAAMSRQRPVHHYCHKAAAAKKLEWKSDVRLSRLTQNARDGPIEGPSVKGQTPPHGGKPSPQPESLGPPHALRGPWAPADG